MRALQRSLELDGQNAEAHTYMGNALALRGDVDGALNPSPKLFSFDLLHDVDDQSNQASVIHLAQFDAGATRGDDFYFDRRNGGCGGLEFAMAAHQKKRGQQGQAVS